MLSESLELYFNEIGKVALLKPEQEIKLARRIKLGEDDALETLVTANLRFVVLIAKQSQYQNRGLTLSELINEGNIGLIEAAKRFDVEIGPRFPSYAFWWIRRSITEALADQGRLIRIPRNKIEDLRSMERMQPDHLSQRPNWARDPISLDVPETGDGTSKIHTLPDTNPTPDELLIESSIREEVAQSVDMLSEREQLVVRMYFGFDNDGSYSMADIGVRLGLCRERIRQIIMKAIQKIRKRWRKDVGPIESKAKGL